MRIHKNVLSSVLTLAAGASAWQPAFALELGREPASLLICTDTNQVISRDKSPGRLYMAEAGERPAVACQDDRMAPAQAVLVKRRGHSSASYAKQQFQLDMIDQNAEELKLEFLGLGENDKWVLHGPYIDRSYIRNALAYTVGRQLGSLRQDMAFAPAIRFVEVSLNDQYQGLYLLTEKIGRSHSLVNVPKFDPAEPQAVHPILEVTVHGPDFTSRLGTRLQYSYPSRKKMETLQNENPAAAQALTAQITQTVDQFERSIADRNFADPVHGYAASIDRASFIDYFLMEEVFKQLDGFRSSLYFYKGNDGLIHIGPLWDFDTAAGNVNFIWGTQSTKGWVHRKLFLYNKPVFWFKRLLDDRAFAGAVAERYHSLRQAGMPLHDAELGQTIASVTELTGTARQRDAQRWQGTHNLKQRVVTNTKKHGKTPDQNLAILHQWLIKRLHWLDKHIGDVGK